MYNIKSQFAVVRGPVMLFTTIVCVSLVLAGLRLSNEPAASTVKVAGITVEQSRNYWDEVIDLNTPQDQAHAFADEFSQLEEHLPPPDDQLVSPFHLHPHN